MTTNTFRAAHTIPEIGSSSVGVRLTEESDQHLSDEALMEKARVLAAEEGIIGEIVIGDWRE